ncbi:MAG: amidohydrolase/deacetylase family metallohydrolase [Acidobacteria bacterium]|nr:amidohydrolase/deacetylase family metallohydrolase [Acidobacteriota bacterium]
MFHVKHSEGALVFSISRFLLPIVVAATAILAPCRAQTFDLLLKSGHVIDPANKINAVRDVAMKGDTIARIDANIPATEAKKVVDVSGYYVTPGLVDIHTHLSVEGPGGWGIYPDLSALPNGVTTAVDAGSSGWKNFEEFKSRVIDGARTRVLALLNIVGVGMDPVGEQSLAEMDARPTAEMVKKYPQILVGIKAAHYEGPEWDAIDRAVEAGRLARVPVMVDFRPQPTRTYADLILKHLRPGDIHTHMYAQHIPLLDDSGRVNDYVREARKRGIVFDLGHGGGSFWFRIASPAMEQGFTPDSISTDLHQRSSLIPQATMVNVMSKILSLGMPLEEVIYRSTVTPAREIQRPELGTLSVGADADIAVLELQKGNFGFVDSGHGRHIGNQKLRCMLTVRAGKIVFDAEGISWPEWRKAGKYGVVE